MVMVLYDGWKCQLKVKVDETIPVRIIRIPHTSAFDRILLYPATACNFFSMLDERIFFHVHVLGLNGTRHQRYKRMVTGNDGI